MVLTPWQLSLFTSEYICLKYILSTVSRRGIFLPKAKPSIHSVFVKYSLASFAVNRCYQSVRTQLCRHETSDRSAAAGNRPHCDTVCDRPEQVQERGDGKPLRLGRGLDPLPGLLLPLSKLLLLRSPDCCLRSRSGELPFL